MEKGYGKGRTCQERHVVPISVHHKRGIGKTGLDMLNDTLVMDEASNGMYQSVHNSLPSLP